MNTWSNPYDRKAFWTVIGGVLVEADTAEEMAAFVREMSKPPRRHTACAWPRCRCDDLCPERK